MTDEQRAHEIALEIMKMQFALIENDCEEDDGQKVLPVDELVGIYNAAYNLVING